MSYEIVKGDILKETTGVILQGINCQGVMNSGIAKDIRTLYPNVYDSYMFICKQKTDKELLGNVFTCAVGTRHYISSGFTQLYYGRNPDFVYVDYDAIKSVFEIAAQTALNFNLPLKFPKIGAGLGNGDWNRIEKIIKSIDARIIKAGYHLNMILYEKD